MSSSEPRPTVQPPKWWKMVQGVGGLWLAFVWGVAEGTFFFIVPDVLLTLTALLSWRAAFRQTAAVIAGSLVAGAAMFLWSQAQPARAAAAVAQVPFVRPAMQQRVREDYATHGTAGLLRGPMSGIPYKVYAVEAPKHVELGVFLLISVPARLERLIGSVLLFGAVGWVLRRKIQRLPWIAVAIHAVYWIVVYAFYWRTI